MYLFLVEAEGGFIMRTVRPAKTSLFYGYLLVSTILTSGSLYGETLINPAMIDGKGRTYSGAVLAMSKIDYDMGGTSEITRKIIGAELGVGLGSHVDLIGQGGYSYKSTSDRYTDGDGFMFGAGLRGLIHSGRNWRFVGYGLVNYLQEEYKYEANDTKYKLTLTDLHLGATAGFAATSSVRLFCGLEFIMNSDGSINAKGAANANRLKFDRADNMNILIGTNISAGSSSLLRAEAAFAGEQTFTFAWVTSI